MPTTEDLKKNEMSLLAQASKMQERANLMLASYQMIRDYADLTQRLVQHINLTKQHEKHNGTDGGTLPTKPQPTA